MAAKSKALKFFGVVIGAPAFGLIASSLWPQKDCSESRGFKALSIGEAYLATLQTGDIVFFNQPDFQDAPLKWLLSSLAKTANGSDCEHIGVIVWSKQYNYPFVLEHTWSGPQLTNFEDRILHSGAQDIMLRSIHLMRTPEMNNIAGEFVDAELDSREVNPLAFSWTWAKDIYNLSRLAIKNISAPKSSPPVKRLLSMDDIAVLMGTEEGTTGLEDSLDTLDAMNTFATSQTNIQVAHNAANIYGELDHTIKMLRQTETRLHESLLRKSQPPTPTPAKPTQSWGAYLKSFVVSAPEAVPEAPKMRDNEELLLLLRRQSFLQSQLNSLYNEYRDEMLRTGSASTPAFRDADMVARLFMKVGVLPKSPKDGVVSLPASLPPHTSTCDEDIAQYDLKALQRILAENAPYAHSYTSNNFREHSYLKMQRGVGGTEQYVTQSFNKPPWEVRA